MTMTWRPPVGVPPWLTFIATVAAEAAS